MFLKSSNNNNIKKKYDDFGFGGSHGGLMVMLCFVTGWGNKMKSCSLLSSTGISFN